LQSGKLDAQGKLLGPPTPLAGLSQGKNAGVC
jgi:hypothetical protein